MSVILFVFKYIAVTCFFVLNLHFINTANTQNTLAPKSLFQELLIEQASETQLKISDRADKDFRLEAELDKNGVLSFSFKIKKQIPTTITTNDDPNLLYDIKKYITKTSNISFLGFKLFNKMIKHFGNNIKIIEGTWKTTHNLSENLFQFQQAVNAIAEKRKKAGKFPKKLTEETLINIAKQAALKNATGIMAHRKGFKHVKIIDLGTYKQNQDGSITFYGTIKVHFAKNNSILAYPSNLDILNIKTYPTQTSS